MKKTLGITEQNMLAALNMRAGKPIRAGNAGRYQNALTDLVRRKMVTETPDNPAKPYLGASYFITPLGKKTIESLGGDEAA